VDGHPSPRSNYHSEFQAIEGSGVGNLIEFGFSVPNISAVYPGSTVKSFDLHSFWVGCEIAAPGQEFTVPQACAVQATGVRGDGKAVGPQRFVYSLPSFCVQVAGMEHAVLSAEFVGLVNLTLAVVAPAGLDLVYSVLYDDLDYTLHDACC
jgi:hypothetical protein